MTTAFRDRVQSLLTEQEHLLSRPNLPEAWTDGLYRRYHHPVLTAAHVPVAWRYDLREDSNPLLLARIGANSVFNAGAILHEGRYLLCVRVEGMDRKSYFAMAESPNGVDGFRFWERPIALPEAAEPATNVYDMRLVAHEDGWVYGFFCAERHDDAHPDDLSAATATAGICRTRDFLTWERLPDLVSASQQRNVVLHPEFVNGKYALYTRPQDGFIEVGGQGGICGGLTDSMENHLGDYVLRPGMQRLQLVRRDTVYQNPRRIGLLIHGRNASSAEQYILEAKESEKVVLFGNERTSGTLDLSNVFAVTSPSGWLKLYIPTTRSCRWPDIVIDGKGIAPQIPIPHEVSRTEALQERDGIGEEIRYIERVLRGLPCPGAAEQ